jgi:exopolyphosphatase/guanosine-5'-triphosphate,3'-diphosphate pyrophosphatase
VLRACIDIGSNTTRLLVADREDGVLTEVHQERAFTQIGSALGRDARIPDSKLEEVAEVVERQLASARELGVEDVRCVATAAVRHASNGGRLVEIIERRCPPTRVEILSGEQEARLAFIGAIGTMRQAPAARMAVLDVGGGSSELAIGDPPDRVLWWASLPLGSAELTGRIVHSDPPGVTELTEARRRIAEVLSSLEPPPVAIVVAVGGSATSCLGLTGARLHRAAVEEALALLAQDRAAVLAPRLGLDPGRVRLLPAGLLILQGLAERLGTDPMIGRGGLREGILLEGS